MVERLAGVGRLSLVRVRRLLSRRRGVMEVGVLCPGEGRQKNSGPGKYVFMGHPLLDLADQTAVVIGGTSGIGLALTRALAQAGANVVPTGRRAPQVAAAVAEVEGLGRQSLNQTCDVTSDASLAQLL